MQIDELTALLHALNDVPTDTAHVEIKAASHGMPERLWETLSSFANASGGVIILGVAETEAGVEINGVKDPGKLQKDVASLCDRMVPPLRSLIELHKLHGKHLITIEVPEVSYKEKPCYYHGSGMNSGAFIRVSDGDRRLTQYEVQGFLDGRGQPLHDVEIVPGSAKSDLSPALLNGFLDRMRGEHPKMATWDDQRILRTFRILVDHEGTEAITLCGLLCFGTYPQSFLPSLCIHVLAYPRETEGQTGPLGERLLDDVKIEGPLLTMVPEAITAIKKNLSRKVHVGDLARDDVWPYPERFFREAVVNAIVHRDYSPLARGSAVQIKVFPHRIEIANPGGLFGPMTEDRLGEGGLMAARNGFLVKLLEDAPVPGERGPLCENRGTGIPAMIHELRQAGMEPPEFKDHRNHFQVVCHDRSLFDQETLRWLGGLEGMTLSERQRYALAYARNKGKLTNADYRRINECDSREATKELGALVKGGFLRVQGARRWAVYALPAEPVAASQKRGRRRDWTEDILHAVSLLGAASRSEIQEKTGLNAPAARFWIARLIRRGRLTPTTAAIRSPRVKYKLKGKQR